MSIASSTNKVGRDQNPEGFPGLISTSRTPRNRIHSRGRDVALVDKIDLSKVATMPTQDAIGILNEFTIDQLVYIFTKYPELNQKYGSLYLIGIIESRSPETKVQSEAAEAEKLQIEQAIATQDVIEWRSDDDYVRVNHPGTVSANVSKNMGSDLLRLDELVVSTLPMLIDWWMVYLYSRDLVQGDEIMPNQRILDAFRQGFNNRGVPTNNVISVNIFTMVVADEFTEGGVSLTNDAKNYLFNQAIHLRSILDKTYKQ